MVFSSDRRKFGYDPPLKLQKLVDGGSIPSQGVDREDACVFCPSESQFPLGGYLVHLWALVPDVPVLVVGDDDPSASLRVVKHETVVVGGGGGEGQRALGQQPLQDLPVVTLALLHPILEV